MIQLKRAYVSPEKSDGFRILVDRLWPRGLSKKKAQIDLWVKEVAPSDSLRKWFSHDPKKWIAFQKKYKAELRKNTQTVQELRRVIRREKKVTLVFAAKDEEHNQAIVLKWVLQRK
ncbi:MAG TPA: DUF488 family protein [Patescibacteria group bacterium]|nr:DUF488 family protein [Patescibacteria group bacterium]